MNNKKFEITIRTNMTMPDGKKVKAALENGEKIPAKVTFTKESESAPTIAILDGKKIGIASSEADALADVTVANYNAICERTEGAGIIVSVEILEATDAKETNTAAIDEFADEIAAIGDPDGTVSERVDYMLKQRVPVALIKEVLRGYGQKYNAASVKPKVLYQDPDKTGTSVLGEALLNAVCGNAVILEGDASVGKNVMVESIAWCLDMPYYCITMGKKMSTDDIYGTKTTDNSASDEITVDLASAYIKAQQGTASADELLKAARYEMLKAKCASVAVRQELSPFVEWAEFGGVLNMNELNIADPNFLSNLLNPVTDGTGFINAPGRGRVDLNKRCVLFGTQNSGAIFKGTSTQNAATMSRFGIIRLEAPKSIKNILQANFVDVKVPSEIYKDAETFYKSMLNSFRAGTISSIPLNIRGIVRAIKATIKVPGFTTFKRQLEQQVANACQGTERQAVVMEINDKIKC